MTIARNVLGTILLLAAPAICPALTLSDNVVPTHPETNSGSPVMLRGDWFDHPHAIDFDKLPRVPKQHAVVNNVTAAGGANQHNYLVHYDAGRRGTLLVDPARRKPHGPVPRQPPQRLHLPQLLQR